MKEKRKLSFEPRPDPKVPKLPMFITLHLSELDHARSCLPALLSSPDSQDFPPFATHLPYRQSQVSLAARSAAAKKSVLTRRQRHPAGEKHVFLSAAAEQKNAAAGELVRDALLIFPLGRNLASEAHEVPAIQGDFVAKFEVSLSFLLCRLSVTSR